MKADASTLSAWLAGAGLLTAFAVLNPLLLGQHFSLILTFVGHVPLLYVGFRFGLVASVYASVIGLMAVIGLQLGIHDLPDGALAQNALQYVVRYAIPAIALTFLSHPLRQNDSAAYIPSPLQFTAFIGLGALITLASTWTLYDQRGDFVVILTNALNDITLQTGQDVALPDGFITGLVNVMGGLFGTSWLLLLILNIWLARMAVLPQHPLLSPLPRLTTLAMPQPVILLTAVIFGLALFTNTSSGLGHYASNLAIMLMVPFLLVGLGIVHAFAAPWEYRKTFLWIFYIVSLITPYPLLIVLCMGAFDPLVNFRRWAAPRGKE